MGVGLLACGDDDSLPPLDHAGERVRMGTQLVDSVCKGTLVHVDGELDRIEAELGLTPNPDGADIYVVDQTQLDEYCEPNTGGCWNRKRRSVFLAPEKYDEALVHELTHDRVERTSAGSSKTVFIEGIAYSMHPWCMPVHDDWDPPPAEEIFSHDPPLSARLLVGELFWWLRQTSSPKKVLAFMADVDPESSDDSVRAAFWEHFDAYFDDEVRLHWRSTDGPFSGSETQCVSPEVPRAELPARLVLEATLDCGSERVRNDFANPDQVFVEWTLTIDKTNAGDYHLMSELPEGTQLSISGCTCIPWQYSATPLLGYIADVNFDSEHGLLLEPGVYRIRWQGPLGSDAKLDVEISTPG